MKYKRDKRDKILDTCSWKLCNHYSFMQKQCTPWYTGGSILWKGETKAIYVAPPSLGVIISICTKWDIFMFWRSVDIRGNLFRELALWVHHVGISCKSMYCIIIPQNDRIWTIIMKQIIVLNLYRLNYVAECQLLFIVSVINRIVWKRQTWIQMVCKIWYIILTHT